jgi:putative DNA methylase
MTTDRTSLIELDAFPIEFLSQLAERESWRKEIHRPVHHLHKWWATRLGSVFRGILLGSVLPAEAKLENAFYQQHSFAGLVVFDPFMGSGITLGEAHKLGFATLGRDINPVAAEAVRVVLGPLDPDRIHDEFRKLEEAAGRQIRGLYKAVDDRGAPCEVLYYFWVKQVACVHCGAAVDLFSSRIIARNAYPDRKPEIRVSCPGCGDIFTGSLGAGAVCPSCGCRFDPRHGNATGKTATCSSCACSFPILEAVRKGSGPPAHRLIGKLVLTASGDKRYLPATSADHEAYQNCTQQLQAELAAGNILLPSLELQDGHNTRQALNYGYRAWRDFFNDRQLLGLCWLQNAIAAIEDTPTRELLLTLFSGTLEFNNLFASYKGEGTGAVRHMFSHHILKPERMPIEANVWGTPRSSGSFSGLYRTRVLRAIEYRARPVEVAPLKRHSNASTAKVALQCSPAFSGDVQTAWPPAWPLPPRSIHLACGSSDATGLPASSVDLVITDPPFFDNVHYSELADFFLAWQSIRPHGFLRGFSTSRCSREVQDKQAEKFAQKLTSVFAECHRVLKDEGALVFTYHHSRPDGWVAMATAIWRVGFFVINAHPVRAEMSLATPKSQAREPIQLDVILVCRKLPQGPRPAAPGAAALPRALTRAVAKAARLRSKGFDLSRNDRRVILYSQFLAELGPATEATGLDRLFAEHQAALEAALDDAPFCDRAAPGTEPLRVPATGLRQGWLLE